MDARRAERVARERLGRADERLVAPLLEDRLDPLELLIAPWRLGDYEAR